jgi:hypothetical protein
MTLPILSGHSDETHDRGWRTDSVFDVSQWRIIDGPEDVSNFDKDASVWLWTIERDGVPSYVEVTVTLPSVVSAGVPGEVRDARESKGRTAVEAYLDEDAPPRNILVSTQGIGV